MSVQSGGLKYWQDGLPLVGLNSAAVVGFKYWSDGLPSAIVADSAGAASYSETGLVLAAVIATVTETDRVSFSENAVTVVKATVAETDSVQLKELSRVLAVARATVAESDTVQFKELAKILSSVVALVVEVEHVQLSELAKVLATTKAATVESDVPGGAVELVSVAVVAGVFGSNVLVSTEQAPAVVRASVVSTGTFTAREVGAPFSGVLTGIVESDRANFTETGTLAVRTAAGIVEGSSPTDEHVSFTVKVQFVEWDSSSGLAAHFVVLTGSEPSDNLVGSRPLTRPF